VRTLANSPVRLDFVTLSPGLLIRHHPTRMPGRHCPPSPGAWKVRRGEVFAYPIRVVGAATPLPAGADVAPLCGQIGALLGSQIREKG
jgi:hypothetical protein